MTLLDTKFSHFVNGTHLELYQLATDDLQLMLKSGFLEIVFAAIAYFQ